MIRTGKKVITFVGVAIAATLIYGSAGAAVLMRNADQQPTLKVFYHEQDTGGWNAVLVGKLESIGMKGEVDKGDITAAAQDKSKAAVRLYHNEGIRQGEELFVVNDRNLVVSRIEVKTLFKSASFGHMLVGYGNLRLARAGNRVVQRVEDQYSRYAYIYSSRGDFYGEIGDEGEAIKHYKKAIELDRGNPEAHLALGLIYLKGDTLQFAFKEFSEAYKRIARMYDKEDRYILLKSMAETRYREAYFTRLSGDLRNKYIKEGIRYAEEALGMHKDSREAHFYLGMFHYRNPDRSDVKARDHMLKVLELDPENVDACLILAELYYNHGNKGKARSFAEQALKIDGTSERARFIKRLSEQE
ncbi:MAG TPA: tetratricopeptide repeat protein [Spirochaetota bacterium]|nr:tetratricopeptide repeat protein [Spirochaetota bacterium]